MLERASTCLENGARLSSRSARRTRLLQRQLHSAFFTHDTLDLDLSALTLDTSLWRSTRRTTKPEEKSCEKLDEQTSVRSSDDHQDTGFLDFLYPRQALAWLRRDTTPQYENWETRNVSRLPKGYVHASRKYSSAARTQYVLPTLLDDHKDAFSARDQDIAIHDSPPGHNSYTSDKSLEWYKLHDASYEMVGLNLHAEQLPDIMYTLEQMHEARVRIYAAREQFLARDTVFEQKRVNKIVAMYNAHPEKEREHRKLLAPFLEFLSEHHESNTKDDKIMVVYNKLGRQKRTPSVYRSIISTFLRCKLLGLANQALLEGEEDITPYMPIGKRTLLPVWSVAQALFYEHWAFAYKAFTTIDDQYADSSDRVFRTLSSLGDSLPQAAELSEEMYTHKTIDPSDALQWRFLMKFLKAAITRDLLFNFPTQGIKTKVFRLNVHTKIAQLVIQQGSEEDKTILKDVFEEITKPTSDLNFDSLAAYSKLLVTGWLLKSVEDSHGTRSRLLWQYIVKLMERTPPGLDSAYLQFARLDDMIEHRMRLDDGVIAEDELIAVMKYYASKGSHVHLAKWTSLYRKMNPHWATSSSADALTSEIEVYAARRDATGAKDAFEKLASEARASTGVALGRPYWNVYVKALVNGGYIHAAYHNVKNLIRQGETPDAGTMKPILDYLADRGDQAAIEHLLKEYEQVTGRNPPLTLVSSVLKAQVTNHDLYLARKTLANRIRPLVPLNDHDALTEPYNLVLMEAAERLGVKATQSLWDSMLDAKVRPDATTYAALAQSWATDSYPLAPAGIIKRVARPTALHYGILMRARLVADQASQAILLYDRMIASEVRSSPLVEKLHLLALEREEAGRGNRNGLDVDLLVSKLDFFLKELTRPASEEMVFPAPYDRVGGGSFGDTIGTILAMLGSGGHLEEIQTFITKYHAYMREKGPQVYVGLVNMPIEMLNGLMSAFLVNDRHTLVQKIWRHAKARKVKEDRTRERWLSTRLVDDAKAVDSVGTHTDAPYFSEQPWDGLASQEAEDLLPTYTTYRPATTSMATTTAVTPTEKPWPVRRKLNNMEGPIPLPPSTSLLDRLLSTAFRFRFVSLARQQKLGTMLNELGLFLKKGNTMDRVTINAVVQQCLATQTPMTTLAFRLTERYMIRDFPGWQRALPDGPNKTALYSAFHLMRPTRLTTLELRPYYSTLILLLNAYLKMKLSNKRGLLRTFKGVPGVHHGVGSIKMMYQRTPLTLQVLFKMPHVPGEPQQEQFISPYEGHGLPERKVLLDAGEAKRARASKRARVDWLRIKRRRSRQSSRLQSLDHTYSNPSV